MADGKKERVGIVGAGRMGSGEPLPCQAAATAAARNCNACLFELLSGQGA